MQDEVPTIRIYVRHTEYLSKNMIDSLNLKVANVRFVEAVLVKDTSPWITIIELETSEDYSVADAIRALPASWIIERIWEGHTNTYVLTVVR